MTWAGQPAENPRGPDTHRGKWVNFLVEFNATTGVATGNARLEGNAIGVPPSSFGTQIFQTTQLANQSTISPGAKVTQNPGTVGPSGSFKFGGESVQTGGGNRDANIMVAFDAFNRTDGSGVIDFWDNANWVATPTLPISAVSGGSTLAQTGSGPWNTS